VPGGGARQYRRKRTAPDTHCLAKNNFWVVVTPAKGAGTDFARIYSITSSARAMTPWDGLKEPH
jgi:hypothetical protein